jgi:hypothetical protein
VPPSEETHRVHDPALVLAALEEALTMPVPPSLAAVNRTLHISDRQLMRTHPELCAAIIERHLRWLEDRSLAAQGERQRLVLAAIADVHATGAYPSRRRVQDRLPPNVSLRDPRLERLWKDEVTQLGFPRPSLPVRPGRGVGRAA